MSAQTVLYYKQQSLDYIHQEYYSVIPEQVIPKSGSGFGSNWI